MDKTLTKAWLGQPYLIKKLKKKFGKYVEGLKQYKTPGTPNFNIKRNSENKVDTGKQKLYRSGVGMLLFLVKHSRPDIANVTRELSKCSDGADEAA